MTTTNNRGANEDCIEKWKSDLHKASNALTKKQAKLNKAEAMYANAQMWAKKLEDLCTSLENTDGLSKDVLEEIGQIDSALETVCTNTACIREVLDILYCIIKDFYECTDALKQKLADIKREIECLNDPGLNANTSIVIKCIEDLCAKIDEALKTQQELIKKLIEVIRCASQLHASLCDSDCSLYTLIKELERLFSTGPEENEADCNTDSCDATLQPKPSMPLDCDPYYEELKETSKKAESERETAAEERSTLRKKRDSLQSLKSSLEDAIEAAQAAKDCK